ncbi:DeoR/GlpR family DNA-binding transcription regulator [Quadrisphaera sp. DSM 44207]|uniref:DeoR/GlpR family DNA-binding transcription regulator n=1 Tax=Quadrisphaera sp. DSM 44207 TaxID=1881057 RepID=UPI00088EC668|nr:DeoR/GlpR family DNA-binding transcription regulator [Quadrisphaera sp. DSM 44207]SDQ19118.1 transcriptional regulator, DeoR family [Quadrisphaera sp. DSM 44207]
MYAAERQEAIAGLVRSRGRVAVSDVAVSFGVTTETVRRDLGLLERTGLVRRVHGGAVATSALSVLEPGVLERESTAAEAKERIAARAVELVPPRGSVLLDAGTTTARLAGLLPTDRDLLVVTNAVPVAARLAGARGVRLHLLGGRVRGRTQAAVGEEALRALADLRVDVAFVGTNALSLRFGLSTPDHDEAAVKRAAVAAAQRVIVLADSSKVGREQLVRFADLDAVDVLVTDDGIDPRDVADLRAREVEVLIA